MNTKNVGMSYKDKITLLSNLSTMLTAGISILETVDSLLEDAKGNQKKLLQVLREDLIQGKHMYITFSKFPGVFDKVTVNIIKASEEAGSLDVTLKDIKTHIQKEMEFIDKIRSAMMYPVLIFVVFVLVLIGILVFVIPRMASVFVRMRLELPLPTKILIIMSNFITQNTIGLIVGFIVFVILTMVLYKKNRFIIFAVIFSIPGISELIKQMDITRFTRSLALLLSSGLTIIQALELTENVVLRRDISRLIKHAKNNLIAGKRLSEGLRSQKNLFPSMVIKLVEAGEKTGSLDKSLQDVSEYMDYQVTRTLETLTTLIEPIMLIMIGFIVGGMMLSIIAPIYGLITQIGTR
ncbi:hypothetical protein A3A93_05765 [Candidatus Roizmanbacteria bacterium RIFCSPLOWO2_01_FULL_38_12]|uniref:Type II secretion system protein GspF domain-containing protein n=1 Tax=Candidatus Roizmanbacteria bacterium RIFCSPLOWO2_01_FULL_38_12 TaxID=1802061 RepID=A0A1F7IV69_9BACT|nr:MAG: hypothetical protein A3F59_03405 [Candidatus Roizmanbacteria bacterium RIFCSPHIGHO2_12_FULL_38_13]OGK47269.1 MAG: hypothetical protein A3A93_05765 [Candidatus Roizmanbacteria bacterium RIFCSPLOWO2_01_FULL_38_12]